MMSIYTPHSKEQTNSNINFKKISSANIPTCVPPVCRHQVIRDLWAFQPAVKATPVGFCNFPGKTAAKHQTSDKGIQYYLSSWPQLPWRFVKLDCQCLNYQNFHRVSWCLITSFVFHDFCHFFATRNLCCPPKSFCIAWACHLWLDIPPFSVDFRVSHTPPAYSCGWSTSDLIQVKYNVSSMMQRKTHYTLTVAQFGEIRTGISGKKNSNLENLKFLLKKSF